jgi:AmiR/NasT family two-component response regulator
MHTCGRHGPCESRRCAGGRTPRSQAKRGLSSRRSASRWRIEQAKGIIIAQQGCSVDQAFQLLVEMSQRSHVKLHDVASDLVARARDQAAGR